jgi:hypothetical protein
VSSKTGQLQSTQPHFHSHPEAAAGGTLAPIAVDGTLSKRHGPMAGAPMSQVGPVAAARRQVCRRGSQDYRAGAIAGLPPASMDCPEIRQQRDRPSSSAGLPSSRSSDAPALWRMQVSCLCPALRALRVRRRPPCRSLRCAARREPGPNPSRLGSETTASSPTQAPLRRFCSGSPPARSGSRYSVVSAGRASRRGWKRSRPRTGSRLAFRRPVVDTRTATARIRKTRLR